jgi:hypothetical protein
MTTLYEIGNITVAVRRVRVVRLNLIERKFIEHAYLVLN